MSKLEQNCCSLKKCFNTNTCQRISGGNQVKLTHMLALETQAKLYNLKISTDLLYILNTPETQLFHLSMDYNKSKRIHINNFLRNTGTCISTDRSFLTTLTVLMMKNNCELVTRKLTLTASFNCILISIPQNSKVVLTITLFNNQVMNLRFLLNNQISIAWQLTRAQPESTITHRNQERII